MASYRKRGKRWQAIVRRKNYSGSESFDTKGAAVAWATGKERESDLGKAGIIKMTGKLRPLIERYEQEIYPIKRWGPSKAGELAALKVDIGHLSFEHFTKAKLLGYAQKLTLAPSGIANRLTYLREVLQTGVDLWDLNLPVDVVSSALSAAYRLSIAGASRKRTRRPTQDELDRVMAYGKARSLDGRTGIDLETIVRVLSIMPLRVGELVDIEWSNLIHERRSAVLRSRKHPDVLEREANHQEIPFIIFGNVDTWKILSGQPEYYSRPFPHNVTSVSDAFHSATIHLGIFDLQLRDLRAHAISTLLEAEIPIPQVAHLSGHRDWKVLQRHYARLKASRVQEAVDARSVAKALQEIP